MLVWKWGFAWRFFYFLNEKIFNSLGWSTRWAIKGAFPAHPHPRCPVDSGSRRKHDHGK
jgi:hypothetical protein